MVMKSYLKNICIFTILTVFLSANDAVANAKYQIYALECASGEPVQVLDYFEGVELRQYVYPNDRAVEDVLGEIEKVLSQDRANDYRMRYQQFKKQVQFSDGGNFGPMRPDWVVNPRKNCQYKVILESDLNGETQINQDLWGRMAEAQKTGVFLNWAIANEGYSVGSIMPSSTIYIRSLNSILTSYQILNWNLPEFVTALKLAGLFDLRHQGVLVDLSKPYQISDQNFFLLATGVEGSDWQLVQNNKSKSAAILTGDRIGFHRSGAVRSLRFKNHISIATLYGDVVFSTPNDFSSSPFKEEAKPRLYFFESGQVQMGYTITESRISFGDCDLTLTQTAGRFDLFRNSFLVFFETGELELATNVKGYLKIEGQKVQLTDGTSVSWHSPKQVKELELRSQFAKSVQGSKILWNGYISFYESGRINCGFIDQDASFSNKNGRKRHFTRGEQVCFDDEENVF